MMMYEYELILMRNEAYKNLDREDAPEMEITVTSIGTVNQGSDGRDEYVLVTRKDDDLTVEQAKDYVFKKVYDPGNGPGQYYCHTVRAVMCEYSTNKAICTIEHRYDI